MPYLSGVNLKNIFFNWRFQTFHLICCAFLVMTLTFLLSHQFYRGTFDIVYMPFSYLGDSHTVDEGNPNFVSMVIFSVGCSLSGILMFIFSFNMRNRSDLKYSRPIRFLGLLAGIGFQLMILPDNIGYFIHDLGTILSLGGIWVITSLLMLEMRSRIPLNILVTMNVILHSTMFVYTFLAAIDSPVKNLFQKAGLVGLFIVSAWAIRTHSIDSGNLKTITSVETDF
jgi:hypothetical protein